MDLRDEVEFLREENRQLKERLGLWPSEAVFVKCRRTFGITPQCIRMLTTLLASPLARRDYLLEAINGWSGDADMKIVDVQLCHLRRALRPHGIEIETVWGTGYRMSPEMKQLVRELLGLQEAA